MQLVVHRDRAEPAGHIEVCEATSIAAVSLLADVRARGGGEWAPAVRHWRDLAIRKVVRRADGKRWDDVQSLPGVNGMSGTAEVRAYVPAPVSNLPKPLAKLQVSATNFPDQGPSRNDDAIVQIVIRPDIDLTTGKAAAQCAHAAQIAWEEMDPGTRTRWAADGYRVSVRTATRDEWQQEWPVRITDAGFTELDGPTQTTAARWATTA